MALQGKPTGLSAEELLKQALKKSDDQLKEGKQENKNLEKLIELFKTAFGGSKNAEAGGSDTYGLLPDTVSGDDKTYAVEAPIALPEPPAAPAKKDDSLDDVFKDLLAHVVQIHHLVDGINDKPAGSDGKPKEEKLQSVLPATLGDFFKQGKDKVAGLAGDASKSLAQTDVGEGLAKAAGAGSEALGGLASGLQTAMSPITALAGAASGAAGAFSDVAGKVMGFVEAFNPSLVEQFGQAMQDLSATIGVALQPVVEGLTLLSREVGAMLLPIMKSLQPVIADLVKTVVAAAAPFIEAFGKIVTAFAPFLSSIGDIVKSLLPLADAFAVIYVVMYQSFKPVMAIIISALKYAIKPLQLFGQFLQAISPALEVFGAVMNGLSEAIMAAVDSLFKALGIDDLSGTFDGLRAQMEQFAAKMALAIAALAKMAGFNSFAKGFIDALKPPEKESNVGIAAAKSVSYQGFEAFSKAISAAASRATGAGTGGAQTKSSSAWLESIQGELEKIKSGDIMGTINDMKGSLAAIAGFVKAITEVATKPQAAYEAGTAVNKRITSAALGSASPFGNMLFQGLYGLGT